MIKIIRNVIVFFLLLLQYSLHAQAPIKLNGKVVDAANTKIGLPNVMVVNARTQKGFFTDADGTFTLNIQKTDTIVFRAFGYHLRKICMIDSTSLNNYNFNVMLFRETYTLKEITVFESRPADSVMKDIQRLGYNKNDYMVHGSQAYQSAITFLYQEFSKKERSKREVAQMMNADKRKSLLRELLFYYYRNSIINLSPDEFDRFIDFSNCSDDLLKSLSAYDLAIYIKSKIAIYRTRM